MVSGVRLSHHVLAFLSIGIGLDFARMLHMLLGYWGYVLMSMHIGFHWGMVMGMVNRHIKILSAVRKPILWVAGILVAGYGGYAFIKRDIGRYMLCKNLFVFFDFEKPIMLFLLDYIAVMGLFVFDSYSFFKWLKDKGIRYHTS